ncbi:MAG: hypothetical protein EA397_16360 [Deltaproteobacteria bacterium]|nr:MAG: hypothetical protein EA397_16360 [Deltaproteobacteria bacterium]
MRYFCLFSLVLAVGACSEYGFTGADVGGDPDGRDPWGGDGDRDPLTDSCEERNFNGFDASINEDCYNEPSIGTFNPQVRWSKRNWSVQSGSNWIMSSPIVVQLTDDNGDGVIDNNDIPDIVVVTFSGGAVVRALSGDTGEELWSTPTNFQITTSPAAADLDGDGLIDIVGVTSNGVEAFNHDGTLKWTRSGVLAGAINGTSDAASITDMDGDGVPEIIVGSGILDNHGNLIARGAHGRAGVNGNVGTASFAVDLDGDGVQEVVVGNALYRKDGTAIWFNNESDGYPAVGDLTGDGEPEIVVVGDRSIRLQDRHGTVLWSGSVPGTTSGQGGPPTIADFSGDGLAEIGVAGGSRYTVFRADGTVLWSMPTNDTSSGNTGSTVFDFEGDGAAEVVYADQTDLWVFNGADGSVKLRFADHSNGTWLEYPVVVDVDNDGHAEIVVVHTPQYGTNTGLTVLGDRDNSWRRGHPIWNQHAFHITNINSDGSVPASSERNWLRYNNFRSSYLSTTDGLAAPDLTMAYADICQLDCNEGRLIVWTHAGNEGMATASSPQIEVVAHTDWGEIFLERRSLPDIPMGSFLPSEEWVIEGLDWQAVRSISFTVDGTAQDCDPNNDVLIVDGPFCQ